MISTSVGESGNKSNIWRTHHITHSSLDPTMIARYSSAKEAMLGMGIGNDGE
jgi:hypothetical protein